MQWQRDIEVLTPLFNRGAYQDTPELRVPSIRGMVRWWFRELEYQHLPTNNREHERRLSEIRAAETVIFGGVRGSGTASRLVFRASNFHCQRAVPNPPTLLHDPQKPSPQAAFAPNATFRLEVLSRFGKLPAALQSKAEAALEVWLLLGALGLRANRTGGNVWPVGDTAPKTPEDLRLRLAQVGCRWPVMLAGIEVGTTLDQLRACATDTVNGEAWVFGFARGRERQASSLKFKVVRLDGCLRLLITAPDQRILDEARRALAGHRCSPETWVALP